MVELFRIPIETPIQPKLDVSAFQRVLIAGFVAGSTMWTRSGDRACFGPAAVKSSAA
jgi:hypothetical protein